MLLAFGKDVCYTYCNYRWKRGENVTVLAIILLILLSLLALALILLCLKLSVRIVYDGGPCVYAGISFIRIKLYPRKEKKKKTKRVKARKKSSDTEVPEKKNEALQSEKNQKKSTFPPEHQNAEKKKTISETVEFIFDIIKKIGEAFGKHGKIYINRLLINVSRPEAADTAVQFGLVCSALSTGLALCGLFGKSVVKDDFVRATPDFITGKSSISADIKIAIRGIYLVIAAMKILVNKYMKNN